MNAKKPFDLYECGGGVTSGFHIQLLESGIAFCHANKELFIQSNSLVSYYLFFDSGKWLLTSHDSFSFSIYINKNEEFACLSDCLFVCYVGKFQGTIFD